jgi:hypothetical protein
MSPSFVYVTAPIDVWPKCSLWEFIDGIDKDDLLKPSGILFDFAKACVLASKAGWEGDFAEYPRIFWIPEPNHGDWVYGFAWKQSNNGTCFIASPVELDHLEEYKAK